MNILPCGCIYHAGQVSTPCAEGAGILGHLERATARVRSQPTRAHRREYLAVLTDLSRHLQPETESAHEPA